MADVISKYEKEIDRNWLDKVLFRTRKDIRYFIMFEDKNYSLRRINNIHTVIKLTNKDEEEYIKNATLVKYSVISNNFYRSVYSDLKNELCLEPLYFINRNIFKFSKTGLAKAKVMIIRKLFDYINIDDFMFYLNYKTRKEFINEIKNKYNKLSQTM